MQPPPTQKVDLTVKTVKNGNDPIVWEMSDGLKKGGPGSYPVVTVKTNAKADFTITIDSGRKVKIAQVQAIFDFILKRRKAISTKRTSPAIVLQ